MNHNHPNIRGLVLAALLFLGCCGLANAQLSLTSTYAAGNAQSGNMFDIKAISGGVLINSFDIHMPSTISDTVEVWAVTGGGTYAGNQANSGAWTLLASPTVTGAGSGVPTPLNLALGFPVLPGAIQGFYITTVGSSVSYTNGTAAGALYASDSFIEFYEGIGIAYQFGGTFTPRIWNGTIHYAPLSTAPDDVAVTGVIAPVGQAVNCMTLSNAETVTVDIANYGMNTVISGSLITMMYQLDNNAPVTETLVITSSLATGQKYSYNFTTTADFSTPGPHTLIATASYLLDGNASNDTLTQNIDSGAAYISSFPFFEDFDSTAQGSTTPPPGWGQEIADASGNHADWYFSQGETMVPGAGPNSDIEGHGKYAYVSDLGEHGQVDLRSPCFDLGSIVNPRLTFWVWSNNASVPGINDATLTIDIDSATTGMISTAVIGPINHIGQAWTLQSLDLTPWFGEVVQLVFRVGTANGNSNHDIAIDNVAIYAPQTTPGQAPQSNLAAMDINLSRNVNQEPVYVPGAGPYFATATVGGVAAFQFEGEPNRQIVLLAGPLNTVAATFPNIGQFDIGGPVDPSTGVPTSLIVLADGGNGQGMNAFFVLSASGHSDIGFGIPNLPLGVLGTFQAVMFTSGANGAPIALSNAVQLTLM